MQPRNEKSVFRHRGYKCSNCQVISMAFGNDPVPLPCPSCGHEALTLEWDHRVTQVVTVEPSDSSPV